MNKDTITMIEVLRKKYKKHMKDTTIYIEYAILKEVVEDLEELKDILKKEVNESTK